MINAVDNVIHHTDGEPIRIESSKGQKDDGIVFPVL